MEVRPTQAPGAVTPVERPAFARPVAALALAAAFAAAWFVPALATVVVWPFLFLAPGWVVVSRCVPDLAPPGRAGLSVVVSVVVSAHLVNVLALVGGGFDRAVVFAAGAILAATSLAVAPLHALRTPRIDDLLGRVRSELRNHPGAWLAALLAVTVVGGVLAVGAWRETADGWVSGGWNWSDFLVHVAIGSSITAGNFPPEVPYAAGAPLTYHWFADFHGALVATAAGVDILGVFIASSALLAGAFVLLTWQLAATVLGDRRAATLAALLAMFAGGMGWIRLPMDLSRGVDDLATLVTTVPYDNTWSPDSPLFRIASVLGTGFLAHRATAFGLPILVAVVLVAWVSVGRRPAGVLLAGALAALLAPFHFYFLPAAYLLLGFVWLARGGWRSRPGLRDAALLLAPSVAALPFIVVPVLLQEGRGAFRVVPGWGEAPFEEGPVAVAAFYVLNLGLPAVIAVLGVLLARRLPARPLLAAWMTSLFVVPNVIVVSAVEFDMNKYFQAMWVAVAILAAWTIRAWPRAIVALVIAVSALSPALVAAWHATSHTVALTLPQERAARWIARETPPGSIFVTDAWINSPVDLAGRLRIASFGPYVANLGLDADGRAADVRSVYCGGDAVAASVMARYGARYVLSPGGLLDCSGATPTAFATSPRFVTVYEDEGVSIWALEP